MMMPRHRVRGALFGLAGAALLCGVVSAARSQVAPSAPVVDAAAAPSPLRSDGAVEALRPGEYLWAPQLAPAGPVMMIISLTTQRAYAYRNGVPIGVSTVSSGKRGHATPTGVFTVLQKAVTHRSNLHADAPMPFMERLTWGGIALHAGHLPGYPASHGCVRLPLAFAKLLYGISSLGMTVVVTDAADVPVAAPVPAMLAPPRGPDAFLEYLWQPERSPSGPLSIVISGQDSRVVVLRNGVEIGSGAIRLDAPVPRTVAFSLLGIDAAGEHWVRLPLPGDPVAATGEMTEAERSQGHLPGGLRVAIERALTPGTTLPVTRSSLKSSGVGQKLTVITGD
ncbi:L,D-transpeptidase [Sphingomonas glacialis]|nr:L,D-transpeptidase [Sphingomonas glacialis]